LLLHLVTLTHTHSVGSSVRGITPSQKPLPENTEHSKQTVVPPAGFEPAVPASDRP